MLLAQRRGTICVVGTKEGAEDHTCAKMRILVVPGVPAAGQKMRHSTHIQLEGRVVWQRSVADKRSGRQSVADKRSCLTCFVKTT